MMSPNMLYVTDVNSTITPDMQVQIYSMLKYSHNIICMLLQEDAKSCAIKKDTVPATKNLIAEQKPSVSDSSGVGNTNKPQRKRQNSSSSK